MCKVAIFDMDGLLIDSERRIMRACIAAAKSIGIDYTQAQYVELIGKAWPIASRIMTEQLGSEANFQQVMHYINSSHDEDGEPFPLKSGARALLEYYQANRVVCGVASSSPLSHIQERLNAVGVLDFFTAITSGHEVENGKPDPDVYQLAMRRLGVGDQFNIEDCIAFEDSDPGAMAAIAAGLKVVVVPDLKQPSHHVKTHAFSVQPSLSAYHSSLTNK